MAKTNNRGKRILEASRQALAMVRDGQALGGQVVVSEAAIDVKAIRQRTGLTQAEFAKRYRFSLARVRDWEQGRSSPDAAMQSYLLAVDEERDRPAPRNEVAGIKRVGITARHLEAWSGTRDAQQNLPLLIRKLIARGAAPTTFEMPIGDDVGVPGWDGFVVNPQLSAWVPLGASYWEIGTSLHPDVKAEQDFSKRLDQLPEEQRRNATFVFATSRRWPAKAEWIAKKADSGWAEVRVYDALDFQHWLNSSPATSIWLGEQLNLSGSGVASLDETWRIWASQSSPALTMDSILDHRVDAKKLIEKAISDNQLTRSIKADSVDEAVAFTCACLAQSKYPGVLERTLVVTASEGWRFVDANPEIDNVVVARPELARERPLNDKIKVFIPFSISDRGAFYKGRAASAVDDSPIMVERLRSDQFEKALKKLGLDFADAQRLTRLTSRSWTVFRRLKARNDAIARPAWLDHQSVKILSTVCLIGSWSAARDGDRAVVERIAGQPYDEVERGLKILSMLDDAPVLAIGSVWLAKSPLELLHLMGPHITQDELERFFGTCAAILEKPNPTLELPEEDRWKAAIFNKVRAESGLVFGSISDSLIKLSVLGPDVENLAVLGIAARVKGLVRTLLGSADEERWLSLYDVLAELAEAAPSEYLTAIEASLNTPQQPVVRLIKETKGSGFSGRCWHADLLRSLEVLAWNPLYLPRVIDIVVRLARHPVAGNWVNTPSNTLLSFFRSWYPQTAAPINRRIELLDRVIQRDAEVGWVLLSNLARPGHDSASPNDRPKWRDDDAGVGDGVSQGEMMQMLSAAGARMIALAGGSPHRLAGLIDKFDAFDLDWRAEIATLIEAFAEQDSSGEDRALVREAVRRYLAWRGRAELDELADLERLEALQEKLAPQDLVIRHLWLFESTWIDLPGGDDGEDKTFGHRAETLRRQALTEIYQYGGFEAIGRLISTAKEPQMIGGSLPVLLSDATSAVNWISSVRKDISFRNATWCVIFGLVGRGLFDQRQTIIELAVTRGLEEWNTQEILQFLLCCPCDQITWTELARLGPGSEDAYWKVAYPVFLGADPVEINNIGAKLLAAGRPRSAFLATSIYMEKLSARLLFEMLDAMRAMPEEDVRIPDHWRISKAFDTLDASREIDESELGRLEFAFIPVLQYSRRKKSTVSNWIASNPTVFAELLFAVFKPRNQPRSEEAKDEAAQNFASNAWSALHHCKVIPGQDAAGSVDTDVLAKWAEEARKLCREGDRAEIGDQTIGQILANARIGDDGLWPVEGVRALLDLDDAVEIRTGFYVGTMNSRGVTSRGYDEGGGQERALAEKYARYASGLQDYPRLADTLVKLKEYYENEALREDVDANLRIEGR